MIFNFQKKCIIISHGVRCTLNFVRPQSVHYKNEIFVNIRMANSNNHNDQILIKKLSYYKIFSYIVYFLNGFYNIRTNFIILYILITMDYWSHNKFIIKNV